MSHENYSDPLTAAIAPSQPRPFFKKKRFLIPAGVLAVSIALGSCSGGAKQAGDASPAAVTAAPPAVAPTTSAAAVPAAAPAAPAAPPAAPAGPVVGAPFSVKMGNGNVAKITIVSAVRTDAVTTTAFATAPKTGSYLLLDVLWETETGKTSSNPFYFSAKDSNGRKADLSLFADNQLGSGDVLPGDKTRGFIAFDIAPGASTVMISTPLMQEAARVQISG